MPKSMIVIPARLAATRLPDKPLAEIAGEPMIVHVWRRAMEADCGPVLVATDSQAVRDAVAKAGGEAVLTRPDHASGSDRIHEALLQTDPARDFDTIVNLQGDLPTLDPGLVRRLRGGASRGRGGYRHHCRGNRPGGGALGPQRGEGGGLAVAPGAACSMRSILPAPRPLMEKARSNHHIGLYAYRRAALERFVGLPPSPLETREKLEQLRALEAGFRIHVGLVDTVPLGVDTPADLARARESLEAS